MKTLFSAWLLPLAYAQANVKENYDPKNLVWMWNTGSLQAVKSYDDSNPLLNVTSQINDQLTLNSDLPCIKDQNCPFTEAGTELIGFIPKILPMEVNSGLRFPNGTFVHQPAKKLFSEINSKLISQPVRISDPARGFQSAAYYRINSNTEANTRPWFYYCVGYRSEETTSCYILWEGDEQQCSSEHRYDGDDCTKNSAMDYCKSHGAELVLPGDLEGNLIAQLGKSPNDITDVQRAFFAPLHNQNGGTFTQQDYWLNVVFQQSPATTSNPELVTYISTHPIYDSNKFTQRSDGWKEYRKNSFPGLPSQEMGISTNSRENDRKMHQDFNSTDGSLRFSKFLLNQFYVKNDDILTIKGPILDQYLSESPLTTQDIRITQNGVETSIKDFPYSSQLLKQLLSYPNHWNAEWIANNKGFGTSVEQRCLVLKIQNMELIATHCAQANTRPMCKLPLKISYQEPQCPIDLKVRHCGKRVKRVKVKQTEFSVNKLVSTQTNHVVHQTFEDEGVQKAYKDFVIDQASRIERSNQYFVREKLETNYGAKVDLYKAVTNNEESINCPCECPIAPTFADPNRDVNYQNAEFQQTERIRNGLSETDHIFCCKSGYRIQATNGYDYRPLANSDLCFVATCDDEYLNTEDLTFWQSEAEISDRGQKINTRAGYYDRRIRNSNGILPGDHFNKNYQAVCVCAEPRCGAFNPPNTLPALNNWTPVVSSTEGDKPGDSFSFTCPNAQLLYVDGIQQTTNTFTISCQASADGCGAAWNYPASIRCEEAPVCRIDCTDAPHGSFYHRSIDIKASGIATLGINDHISFKCDIGYDLYFSGTTTRASSQECCRYCFQPPLKKDSTERHGNWGFQPVLDPQVCECRPRQCEEFKLDPLVVSHPEDDLENRFSRIGYQNSGRVKCVSPAFNILTGHTWQNVNCLNPAVSCERTACIDPRHMFKHHCKSLDRIWRSGNGNDDWEELDRAVFNNGDRKTVFGGQVYHLYDASENHNIFPGSKYRVICNKGHSPYLDFESAMNAENFNKLTGSTCTATCNDFGEWETNCNCKCNSFEKEFEAGC